MPAIKSGGEFASPESIDCHVLLPTREAMSEGQLSRSSQRNFFSARQFPHLFRTYCQFHCQCLLLVDSVISGCHSACSYFPSRSPPAPEPSPLFSPRWCPFASSFRCNGAEKQIITNPLWPSRAEWAAEHQLLFRSLTPPYPSYPTLPRYKVRIRIHSSA